MITVVVTGNYVLQFLKSNNYISSKRYIIEISHKWLEINKMSLLQELNDLRKNASNTQKDTSGYYYRKFIEDLRRRIIDNPNECTYIIKTDYYHDINMMIMRFLISDGLPTLYMDGELIITVPFINN